MDSSRRLAIQLLIEDRLQQRFKGRLLRVELEGESTGAVDQRRQLGVGGAQMHQRFVRIKGKFAAAAIVDHGNQCTAPELTPGWN